MDEFEKSDKYTEIYGNRSLKTAGLNGSQRPDIIAKANDGTYHIWEVASESQASGAGYQSLINKMEIIKKNNPLAIIEDLIEWGRY